MCTNWFSLISFWVVQFTTCSSVATLDFIVIPSVALQAGEFGYLFWLYTEIWVAVNLSHSCTTFLLSWTSQNHYHFSKDAADHIAFISCSGGAQQNLFPWVMLMFQILISRDQTPAMSTQTRKVIAEIAFLQAFFIVLADHNRSTININQSTINRSTINRFWQITTGIVQSATGLLPVADWFTWLNQQLVVDRN